ncbi:Transposase DDE domain protein [Candidatus Nitrosocosmicus oleophilus]|uniref:Transposase DDE domain protein n=3 Tax=Candidatus Nitrosocosmicus oleophilus TaxID=1353260 RepID=A0A654LVD9_9ARCH|nr:IS5-like element ISThar1 family transposase [Candidatus Nitrosocosmicus oleophilus]ALI34391.1 Transposase DDE domain protein [Candidatus Nitrosocosmicus oleophilus]ALI34488.1 Transposase DDE domain protein [Candidatus Nitrosocosmicus oleophilus]ALI34503.1 Transposase DDE domain protein [Candidatus Nitrosocosmicus oleophilus]ALI34801.1 Transposase DDE domain protein [Candidatus Nitrosocosmicus oleophilus]ALI35270.1 Transposase DDE domain protein [Candidatus Nitrosocosmicus oleophilus]
MIDWPSYNRSLVQRGEILFSYDFLDGWGSEIENMNINKKGKPFVFPDSFILAIGYIRYLFHLPYRQTQGIIKATGKRLPANPPSYGHICKRINKLNIDIKRDKMDDDDDLIISIDSTGIKITNRGQWMDEKWNTQNRKGYLKIHVAVDIKTRKIIALEVTDEKVHDGKMLKKLVNHVLDSREPNTVKIKSVLADGAYDSNPNFVYLEDKKINPGIKVRRNSIVSPKNNRLRNNEVKLQAKDLLKWKTKRKYGQRWISETVFSAIKRMFGEYTSANRFQNMVKEIMIKVSLYNIFRRI